MTAYRCAACGNHRRLDQLTRVVDVKSGTLRYVCRVSTPPEGVSPGWCFAANVRYRALDRIEQVA